MDKRQRQGRLGESRVDMFRLSWPMWGQEEERERGEMGPGAAAMRTKVLKE